MMAKLYWRVKRNGKWTWIAATKDNTIPGIGAPEDLLFAQEEEE